MPNSSNKEFDRKYNRRKSSDDEHYSSKSNYSDSNSKNFNKRTSTVNSDASSNKQPIRSIGDWSEYLSSTGKIYYYNYKTEKTQWDKPPEWVEWDWIMAQEEKKHQNIKHAQKSKNRYDNESSMDSFNSKMRYSCSEQSRSNQKEHSNVNQYTSHSRQVSSHSPSDQQTKSSNSNHNSSLQTYNSEYKDQDHKNLSAQMSVSPSNSIQQHKISDNYYDTNQNYRNNSHKYWSESKMASNSNSYKSGNTLQKSSRQESTENQDSKFNSYDQYGQSYNNTYKKNTNNEDNDNTNSSYRSRNNVRRSSDQYDSTEYNDIATNQNNYRSSSRSNSSDSSTDNRLKSSSRKRFKKRKENENSNSSTVTMKPPLDSSINTKQSPKKNLNNDGSVEFGYSDTNKSISETSHLKNTKCTISHETEHKSIEKNNTIEDSNFKNPKAVTSNTNEVIDPNNVKKENESIKKKSLKTNEDETNAVTSQNDEILENDLNKSQKNLNLNIYPSISNSYGIILSSTLDDINKYYRVDSVTRIVNSIGVSDNLTSINQSFLKNFMCTNLNVDLKSFRSFVRFKEIKKTLQEQRLMFLQIQMKEIEELLN